MVNSSLDPILFVILLMTVNCGSPDLDSGWMAAVIRGGALGMPVCKHIFYFFCLSKNSHSRTLAIKNGIILSASIQLGFQIFQETMTRRSINKYHPRDLKFRFAMLRKAP